MRKDKINQIDYNLENNLIFSNQENRACRIFKEQFDLINELHKEDRLKVLYLAILNAFYGINKKSSLNQFENQFENQNENAYISVSDSVSVSDIYNSLNNMSKSVLKLLLKTIECKSFSTNYGGKREGAGRKKTNKISESADMFKKPTIEDIKQYCEEKNKNINAIQFYNFYESKDWFVGKNKMKNWRAAINTWEQNQNDNHKLANIGGLF